MKTRKLNFEAYASCITPAIEKTIKMAMRDFVRGMYVTGSATGVFVVDDSGELIAEVTLSRLINETAKSFRDFEPDTERECRHHMRSVDKQIKVLSTIRDMLAFKLERFQTEETK